MEYVDEEFSFIDVNSNFDVQSFPKSELTEFSSNSFDHGSSFSICNVEDSGSVLGSVEDLAMDFMYARQSSRRRRFQNKGRLARMGNHTCSDFNYKRGTAMYVSRPFEGALSQVDLVMRENPGARKSSMEKGGNWEYFALLEEHASSRNILCSKKNLLYIEYVMPVVAMLQLNNKGMKEPSVENDQVKVYLPDTVFTLTSFRKLLPLAKLGVERQKLLKSDSNMTEFKFASLRAPRGSGNTPQMVASAVCTCKSPNAWFAPSLEAGKLRQQYLEVDLHECKLVKAISTSGKHIRTKFYPQPGSEKGKPRQYATIVSDLEFLRRAQARFFPFFDLWYRVEKSSPLIYLGRFAGPKNNFEEKVVRLDGNIHSNSPVGIVCRFLRIKVVSPAKADMSRDELISWVQQRGMRVSVFGYDTKNSEKSLDRNTQAVSYYIETARSNDRATIRKSRKRDRYIRQYKDKHLEGRRDLRAYCKQSIH